MCKTLSSSTIIYNSDTSIPNSANATAKTVDTATGAANATAETADTATGAANATSETAGTATGAAVKKNLFNNVSVEEYLNDLEISFDFTKTAALKNSLFKTKTEKDIKEELNKELEFFSTLRNTHKIWVLKQEQHIKLRKHWSFSILTLLIIQILALLYIACTRENIGNSMNIFITGVFAEMLFIPKHISEHLFPKSEINHTNEILKLLIEREKN